MGDMVASLEAWVCDWPMFDVNDCAAAADFYVEWDERHNGSAMEFAACYCNAHVIQLRAGTSPFEDDGWKVELRLVRTVRAQRALVAATRVWEA